MTRHATLFVLVLPLVCLVAVGCTLFDDPDDYAKAGDTNVVDNGQADTWSGDTASNFMCNETERAVIEDGGMNDVFLGCMGSCVGDADLDGCTTDCMVANSGGDLSQQCAGCYGDTAACGVQECPVCLADPSNALCTSCQSQSNCLAGFQDCSGASAY